MFPHFFIFIFYDVFYFMCITAFPACFSVPHICIVPTEGRMGHWIAGTGVTDGR